ncbi:hypothetical protein PCANC_23877 [Puccinia coronata f. sp. avenae]|uniref:WW domain-containing protein n=1 Tax=Puccinia coronata f. sp. avenae TaxID=200324 RepID=A0A2N5V9Z4_9BASI|nr:hypothetical protein PCANC_23877 [Puccinia coronata f. sp. avenae]PLW46802.1 hypothetical protein PCASD_06025 [Puccinia coronata f. sp. avenae]
MGIFDKLTKKPTSPPPSYTQQQYPSTNTANATGNTNPYPANPALNTTSAPTGPNSAGGEMRDKDERALPPGWEKQWHDGYARYFYINTRDPSGPTSHWIHPLDQPRGPPAPPPPAHQPPMGATNPQGYYGSQPPPIPQQQAGYMNQQPMYQQQQVPIQASANGRRPGGGMNPLLAGAGGLAGGMLLGSMLESHHEHHHHGDYYDNNNGYTDGYQQGYDSGYANGFDNGDDFGDAGDFGGGFDDGGGFF